MELLLTLFDVFMLCVGFCILFQFRSPGYITAASMGGVLSWFLYVICEPIGGDLLGFFLASLGLTIYAEIMARVFKSPVTGFLMMAILPLVPGSGIYYTMEYCVNGDTDNFINTGLHTFAIAGAIAIGVLVVSSLVRLWTQIRAEHRR